MMLSLVGDSEQLGVGDCCQTQEGGADQALAHTVQVLSQATMDLYL